MYNIAGTYYIWLTRPHAGQYVLKSSEGPFGPYECRSVLGAVCAPIPGSGFPHQGALIDTPSGSWYYMAFMDGFPAGRIPVLAPVKFSREGWPEVQFEATDEGKGIWSLEYPLPSGVQSAGASNPCLKAHRFANDKLDHCWEWNHSPNNSQWSYENGCLVLGTATVTDSLHLASNTLTHRIIGPKSMATFLVDPTRLAEGDRAGVSMFRDRSAYLGIHKDSGSTRLVYVEDIKIKPVNIPVGWSNGHPVSLDWVVDSKGSIRAELPLADAHRVWLRVKADVTPAFSHGYEAEARYATFEYSHDGLQFMQLGPAFAVSKTADTYVGYRFGLFNFATISLGGQLVVEECNIQSWGIPENVTL